MIFSWLNVLQFLLTCLSLILGIYLLQTRRCLALAVYFITLCLHNGFRMLIDVQGWHNAPDFTHALRFFYGPLVYFSVIELLYRDFRYQPRHLIHGVPTVLAAVLPVLTPLTVAQLGLLGSLANIFYLLAGYRAINGFREVVDSNRSFGPPISVAWLQRTLGFYLALIVFETARQIAGPVMPAMLLHVSHLFFIMTICVCLAALVYMGLRSPALIPAVDEEEQALSENLKSRQKRPVMEDYPALASLLQQKMADEKPFLNPQLTVKELAALIDVPARALSEYINDQFDCNFSEYINRARVAEAQRLMADRHWHDQSLLDIGLAAGFNSKTSFNVMFKRITGETPSHFRQQLSAGADTPVTGR